MNDTTTRQHDTAATMDDDDSPALYTLAGLGTAAAAAWGWWQSGSLVAGLAAYGLIDPAGRPTPLGVVLAVVAVFGTVAGAQAVSAGFAWARHRRAGGTTAVPPIPVAAGALAGATVIAGAAFAAFGRGGMGWWVIALPAFALAWAAAVCGRAPARRFRAVCAYAARAEQVLGHGALDRGRDQHGRRQRRRVRIPVTGWGRDDDGIEYPPRITADVGVGYQHKPGELGELCRYAREFGWPAYTWAHDPITKTITGAAAGGVG